MQILNDNSQKFALKQETLKTLKLWRECIVKNKHFFAVGVA
jgi:hypothetical protein